MPSDTIFLDVCGRRFRTIKSTLRTSDYFNNLLQNGKTVRIGRRMAHSLFMLIQTLSSNCWTSWGDRQSFRCTGQKRRDSITFYTVRWKPKRIFSYFTIWETRSEREGTWKPYGQIKRSRSKPLLKVLPHTIRSKETPWSKTSMVIRERAVFTDVDADYTMAILGAVTRVVTNNKGRAGSNTTPHLSTLSV
jgi:hypothetical protein